MRVVWAVLCAGWERHTDGRLDLIGVGSDIVTVPAVPGNADLHVAVGVGRRHGEDDGHLLLRLTDDAGTLEVDSIIPIQFHGWPPGLPRDREAISVQIPTVRFEVNHAGWHTLTVQGDDEGIAVTALIRTP